MLLRVLDAGGFGVCAGSGFGCFLVGFGLVCSVPLVSVGLCGFGVWVLWVLVWHSLG